jgi:hypothetical protein
MERVTDMSAATDFTGGAASIWPANFARFTRMAPTAPRSRGHETPPMSSHAGRVLLMPCAAPALRTGRQLHPPSERETHIEEERT